MKPRGLKLLKIHRGGKWAGRQGRNLRRGGVLTRTPRGRWDMKAGEEFKGKSGGEGGKKGACCGSQVTRLGGGGRPRGYAGGELTNRGWSGEYWEGSAWGFGGV